MEKDERDAADRYHRTTVAISFGHPPRQIRRHMQVLYI